MEEVKLFENETLFIKFASKYGFNLFLGAGFSVYAYNYDETPLPLGNKINSILQELFDVHSKKNLTLGKTCQRIKRNKEDELNTFLRDTYKVKHYDEEYSLLNKFPIKNIFSINIDNLIEKIYDEDSAKYELSDAKISGFLEKDNLINLYKLHGSVTYPYTDRLTFSDEELNDLFIHDNNLFRVVSHKLSTAPCIFWGTSLSDGNTVQLLCASKQPEKINMPKWVVLYPEDEYYDELLEEYHDKGFSVIAADTKALLQYISHFPFVNLNEDTSYIYRKYRNTFPRNFICNELKHSSIVRPITDFFHGAEPQISDVLSSNIVRTSYFTTIFNKVLSSKLTLITGIPGCGKSTILLQLAFCEEFSGRKFWFNNMLPTEAKKLCKLVKDDNEVTIFFDNMYNNLEAFEILKKQNNIKIVTAERNINYEYIKSFLNISADDIIDISDLNEIDIQNICQSMNKTSIDVLNLIKKNANISLLEIVFFAYHSYRVRDRIKEYITILKEFNDDNLKINLLELFTLVNYVSYCGVLTSMDMLYFYFSDKIESYEDILYAIKKMNSVIIESDEFSNLDAQQDYVTIRSRLFAEISIKLLPKQDLKNVLVKFVEKVSPSIIYRYDIFKKKSYDADITNRAFNKKEGIDFYTEIMSLNNSPYVKHQYALFLQRKHDISEAWIQIDQAYTDCSGKIFTIANTHAIILFEKNIGVKCSNASEESQLKALLKRSFDTLEYCIEKDARVNYHVLIYARHTSRYVERFGKDDNAKLYINTAVSQIDEILNSREYIYRKLYNELKSLYNELKKLV